MPLISLGGQQRSQISADRLAATMPTADELVPAARETGGGIMRDVFADQITQLAASDERIVLLSADADDGLFDRFRERFPKRFYHDGITEQNMVRVAAELALSGLRPVAHNTAAFIISRCYEQIRTKLCRQC